MIKQFFDIINFYTLLFLGLIMVSWITWARFLCERVLRNIPDNNFTELRFWVLIYICMIYLYLIKNLIKPKPPHPFIVWLSNLFITPITKLDYFLKYRCFFKHYYKKIMFSLVDYLDDFTIMKIKVIFISFEILPRLILVSFLLLDTFYFNKLKLFYKIILLGLLPFTAKFVIYSLNDMQTHLTTFLEEKYSFVLVFEKGYEGVLSRKEETTAVHHYEEASIKQYIDIKCRNIIQNLHIEDFPYEYVCRAFSRDETYTKYTKQKYNTNHIKLNIKDYDEIRKDFGEYMYYIIKSKLSCAKIDHVKNSDFIKYIKGIIFVSYFICWSHILFTSYSHYPVEFDMFFYLFKNFELYLTVIDDPFFMDSGCSRNENRFTIKNTTRVVKAISNIMTGKQPRG